MHAGAINLPKSFFRPAKYNAEVGLGQTGSVQDFPYRQLLQIKGAENLLVARGKLPHSVRDLRIDPLGRLLLARPDTGELVWVIDVVTNRLVTTLPTPWRADLPNVAPDGSVATASGRDVHFTVPGHDRPRIIVPWRS